MIKKNIYLLLFIGLLLFQLSCKDKISKKNLLLNKQGKILNNNSAVRIDPYIFSARVDKLEKGAVVDILACSKKKSWIAQKEDFWYRIKTSEGMTGWIFGQNLKILSGQKLITKRKGQKIISSLEKKIEERRKDLAGKWWSINNKGEFTQHCLEISPQGKYRSYLKDKQEEECFKGNYNFNFNNSQIIFLAGASFGNELSFSARGQVYILYKDSKKKPLRFKRIK